VRRRDDVFLSSLPTTHLGFRLVQVMKIHNLNGLNPARVTF